MEDPQGGLALAAARFRPGPRLATVTLAVVIVTLTAFIVLSGLLSGTASLAHVWSALLGNGNLASLGQGRTAWAGLFTAVFLLSAGAFWLAAVVRQALSWRRSSGERRQQLKWLASGAAVCGVLGIAAVSTNSSAWEVLILGFAALPLGIGMGILKYRLYEIDRIISRTLAYAIVTGLLVGVYAGLVLLATHVLSFHSTVAVAASTLAAAALFTPLRRRVQHAVDLDSVRTDLTAVVHRALEPAHVSLWLTSRD